MFHLLHKWGKWQTVRKEILEHYSNGMLIPYHVQERRCEKCNLMEVKVSNCKIEWRWGK